MTASRVRTNRHVSDKADRHDGSGLRLRLSEAASSQPLEKGVKAQFSLVRLGKLSYFPAAGVMVLGGPIAPAVLRTQGGCKVGMQGLVAGMRAQGFSTLPPELKKLVAPSSRL